MLTEIENLKKDLHTKLTSLLSELNELYRIEFNIVENEIEKINAKQSFIQLKAEFKGNKKAFEEYI